jgi:hypothetical protein
MLEKIESSGGARKLLAFMLACCVIASALALGCTPTVKVEAPKEPIVINMNIKIEHEIRVKVDKDLEDLFEEDDELF